MRLTYCAILLFAALTAGCSLPAHNYRPSITNVQGLRGVAGKSVAVGEFSAQGGDESKVNSFGMRGSSLVSPYGSFSKYIESALSEELRAANRLDPKSTITVSGVLVRNEVNANGSDKGTASIEAKFTVSEKGKLRYEKTHVASHEWPSSFAGAIALPAVQQNYHGVVQKLLNNLFSDREFLAAIK